MGDTNEPHTSETHCAAESVDATITENQTPMKTAEILNRDPDQHVLHRLFIWMCIQARRVIVLVVGMTVLLLGIVMIVGPGPATIVIPLGLAILATEFVWARKWLEFAKRQVEMLTRYAVQRPSDGDNSRAR